MSASHFLQTYPHQPPLFALPPPFHHYPTTHQTSPHPPPNPSHTPQTSLLDHLALPTRLASQTGCHDIPKTPPSDQPLPPPLPPPSHFCGSPSTDNAETPTPPRCQNQPAPAPPSAGTPGTPDIENH